MCFWPRKPRKTVEQNNEAFYAKCLEAFQQVMEEFAMHPVERNYYPGVGRTIALGNTTTAITISQDFRGNELFISLCKFSNDVVPWGLAQDQYCVYLENVLNKRCPNYVLPKKDLRKILSSAAAAMSIYARDILQGDFSLFAEIDADIRAEKHKK